MNKAHLLQELIKAFEIALRQAKGHGGVNAFIFNITLVTPDGNAGTESHQGVMDQTTINCLADQYTNTLSDIQAEYDKLQNKAIADIAKQN